MKKRFGLLILIIVLAVTISSIIGGCAKSAKEDSQAPGYGSSDGRNSEKASDPDYSGVADNAGQSYSYGEILADAK